MNAKRTLLYNPVDVQNILDNMGNDARYDTCNTNTKCLNNIYGRKGVEQSSM
jgi:hypothetical protein